MRRGNGALSGRDTVVRIASMTKAIFAAVAFGSVPRDPAWIDAAASKPRTER